jgi:choline monooxygenase
MSTAGSARRMLLNLEARYYSDPAVFSIERERIFRRAWQLVGSEATLAEPGSYLAVDIARMGIFVIRGQDGTLRAFHNVCRHRGARLLEAGTGRCAQVRCPYHDWRYDDNGQLIDTPWFGQASPFELSKWGLDPVCVQTWRGLVFVAVDPRTPLLEQLGDLPKKLEDVPLESFLPTGSECLSAPLNWKTYIDQFVEYYHTPSVHSPDKTVGIEHYTAEPAHHMMCMLAPAGSAFYGGRWLWAWPNWTLSVFSGGMKTSRVNPLSTEQIEVHFQYFFPDSSAASEPLRRRVMDTTRSIFVEDMRACEQVQANYSSGAYRAGPLHPQHERAVAYFQDQVRSALVD